MAAILVAVIGGIAYSLWWMWRSMRTTLATTETEEGYFPRTCESCGGGMKDSWKRCPACESPSADYAHRKLLTRLRTEFPAKDIDTVPPLEGEAIVSVYEAVDGSAELSLWIDQFTARGIWCEQRINVVNIPRSPSEHHHLMVRQVDAERALRLVTFFKKGKGRGDEK